MPVYKLIEAHVVAAGRLHGDDTTVPVLAKVRTDIGRIWTYVRDDRPFGGPAPPTALFHYSRDRRGEHPRDYLAGYTGVLQAAAYAGYNELFKPERYPGPATRALCWAHARRKFFILADAATQVKRKPSLAPVVSPIALEAVTRIDRIFDIERGINGKSADERYAVRQELVVPLVTVFEHWLRAQRATLARYNPVAGAIDYMLKDWTAFPVPRRWTDLPNQQHCRKSLARYRPRQEVMAVGRLRPRWPAHSFHVLADRHRQAQRHRSARLAGRRSRPHRRSAPAPAGRVAAVELASA